MSIQSARDFVERVKSDAAFRDALAAAPDKEARVALAKENGYAFSGAELASLRKEYTDDDLIEGLFQESRLGFDSSAGHGWVRDGAAITK